MNSFNIKNIFVIFNGVVIGIIVTCSSWFMLNTSWVGYIFSGILPFAKFILSLIPVVPSLMLGYKIRRRYPDLSIGIVLGTIIAFLVILYLVYFD